MPGSGEQTLAAGGQVRDISASVACALVIALGLRVLLFQPFTIPSDSMEPLLRDGDYIVISKPDYGFSRHSIPLSPPLFKGRILERTPQRGDVIVFKPPHDLSVDYIKRLVGLPGDRIQLIHGVLHLNGKPVAQTVLGQVSDPDSPGRRVTAIRETLPGGKSYTIFQEDKDHEGETTGVYVVPEGRYFFLGDNRDNSADSRWSGEAGVGFVPAENLEGKARVILAAWGPGTSILKPWTWLNLRPGRFFGRLD